MLIAHITYYKLSMYICILLQLTKNDATTAEKLLNNIEKFSDNIAKMFSDHLTSKKFELKRDNFSK